MKRIAVILYANVFTFVISRRFLLKMRNVSDKTFRENQNTHIVFNICYENLIVYEIMWKNMVGPDRSWRIRITCWITKPTDTHS
jgi:hypothetical protein